MLSGHVWRRAVPWVMAALLVGGAMPLFAWPSGRPTNPTGGPGPARSCGASNPGLAGGDECGGKPVDSINTYTGNLTISDMPVWYYSVGDAIPFVISFNSKSGRTGGPLGAKWTHSYDVRIVDESPNGAWVMEGNGWENYFWLNPDTGFYDSQQNVFDKLEAEGSGWKLTRPDQHKLHFDSTGKLTSIQDADGLTWTLAYSGSVLSTVTDPKNGQTTFAYTRARLTQVMMPGGIHADFTYDSSKRLSTAKDAAGHTYTFYYSGTDTKVASLRDPSDRLVRYYYNGGQVYYTEIVSPSGLAVHYDFYLPGIGPNPAGSGQLYVDITETKDGADRITRHIYENTDDPGNGRYFGTLLSVIKDVGGVAATQAYAYDSELRLVRYRDSYQPETGGKSHRHFFYYDDLDNPSLVTKYIDPQNSDASPSDTGTPSPTCPGWKFEYDNNGDGAHLGRLTKITHPEYPAARYTTFSYFSSTSRLYSVTVNDLDRNGLPYEHTTWFNWGPDYQLSYICDALGNETRIYYDSNGYLDYVDLPGGNVPPAKDRDFTADAAGNITAVTDGNGNTTSYQYDGLHRLLQITYPDVGSGQKTKTFTWNCCGLDLVTDENGVQTKYEYDQYTKRLWKVHEDYTALNYVTEYGYDEVGNLKTVKDARSKTTTYFYDGADRRYHADYPDSTHESWTYRDDGRVYSHTDARGRQTVYRYDADDRLWGPAGSGYVAINYPNDTDVSISRDADGLVTSFSDASGTTAISYYPSGWVKQVTNGYGRTVTYDYNDVGDAAKVWSQLSPERSYAYTYTSRNQTETVTDWTGALVSSFLYDNGGRLTRITRPGSYVAYEYNARDWVTRVNNHTTGGVQIHDVRYLYTWGSNPGHTGNPGLKLEYMPGVLHGYNTIYEHDALGRLTRDTKGLCCGATQYSENFTYDGVGNRLTRPMWGGTSVTYTYDNNNKLVSASGDGLSASFGYDSNGNVSSVSGSMFGNWSFTHNDENRLVSVTSAGGTDSYLYNALGQRMRMARGNGLTWRFQYNGERTVGETNDANVPLVYRATVNGSYYAPSLRSATEGSWCPNSPLVRYPAYDAGGNFVELVDPNGNACDRHAFDAFGVLTSDPSPQLYSWGGAWGYMEERPGNGLVQLGARWYWPEIGRFLEQDPDGDGVNWYAYADNNPLTGIDPEGQQIYAPWNPESTWYHVFSNDEGAWSEFPKGAAAAADFAYPFGDPFAARGVYNPCEQWVPGTRIMTGIAIAAAGSAAAIAGAEAAGVLRFPEHVGGFELNLGRNLRIGWHRLPTKGSWRVAWARGRSLLHAHLRAFGRGIGRHWPWQ